MAKWGSMSLEHVRERAAKFSADRHWDQFHTPRNLLCALVGEVGELSECFQWKGEVQKGLEGFSDEEKIHVGEEMVDVFVYLIRLADKCNVDLPSAITRKMTLNEQKYPVHLAKGRATKYDKLAEEEAQRVATTEETSVGDKDDNGVEDEVIELGKKSYWDDTYADELTYYQREDKDDDTSDSFSGHEWFDEHTGRGRLVTFLSKVASDRSIRLDENSSVLDLGCGSGGFLRTLAKSTLIGALVGVDYSEAGCTLAASVTATEIDRATRCGDNSAAVKLERIKFVQDDVISYCQTMPDGSFDIVHDKGTLDAIYLSRKKSLDSLDDYVRAVHGDVLKNDGVFVITSCNLTKEELETIFNAHFLIVGQATYPVLQFGGSSGSPIVTVAFARR